MRKAIQLSVEEQQRRASRIRDRNRTHGMTGTVEFNTWQAMRQRCYDKNYKSYMNYGGRGITICERWRSSLENFFEDMGPRPTAEHSIDRIDVNGNYEPGNCRWATRSEQANNKVKSKYYDYRGTRGTLKQLCEKTGMRYGVAKDRIDDFNWPIEKALETPIRKRKLLPR